MFSVVKTLLLTLFFISLTAAYEEANESVEVQSTNINGDNALEIMEAALRAVSNNKDFRLPDSFRNPDGTLKKVNLGNHDETFTSEPTKPKTCQKVCSDPTGVTCSFAQETQSATIPFNYAWNINGVVSVCFSLNGQFKAISLNAQDGQASTKNLAIGQPEAGLTCTNCFAQVGANAAFSMECTIATLSCTIAFSTGGDTRFNLDLALKDPKFNFAAPLTIVSPPADPANAGSYTPLATYSGITIAAAPALSSTISGTGSLVGTASVVASFSTNADYVLSLVGTDYAQNFAAAIAVQLPAFDASQFTLASDTNVNFSIEPTVYWRVSFGITGADMFALFRTPFKNGYTFNQVIAKTPGLSESLAETTGSVCTSTQSLEGAAYFTSVGLTFPTPKTTYSFPTGTPPAYKNFNTQQAEAEKSCLATGSAPIPAPAPAPGPASGTDSSNDGLSDGEIAGAVIGSIAGFGLLSAGVYFSYLAANKPALAGEGVSIGNPVRNV